MSDSTKQKTYFENMSRAYARNCVGATYVMTKDIHNIPTDGIWSRVEQPELQKDGGAAESITAVRVGTYKMRDKEHESSAMLSQILMASGAGMSRESDNPQRLAYHSDITKHQSGLVVRVLSA
ncbi:uncharacterized protein Z518_06099 [Rhinocladiella mackenziei CBS 650.93]|uniref:Uncharacterized protein n=1 Tax=Rhinocladiella mackenziei CBS 650.93 TaxID=1442369 RepID=A0A0D2FSY2_9EURO|nr:uncharacterized protein Z518_06099 [Rhinocladiella mackenziei CBS 650.93]KIX05227.1 hypothetical protein Z518_06099 [Rhinocladiella mackenziei CBS 650.93]